jgi:WD40 repeat protein
MSSQTKKQKLLDDHEVIEVVVASSGCVAAVTALAVLSSDNASMIFSGHRDGTIRRWDNNHNSGKNHDDPQQPRAAVWTISACPDLTQHELYGREERLGIAGLAVRQQQQDDAAAHPDDEQQHVVLYSWNHQREDMRASNGIPQKIMIWKCTTGERCSALMIDVGRSIDGTFANPLVSCMVFCKLLVAPPPAPSQQRKQPPQQQGAAPNNVEEANTATVVEKVWVDTVLVGLQATCDTAAPTIIASTTAATVVVAENATTTAASPAKQRPATTTTVTTTGNLVPFHEQTRQRMRPWIVPGGFVRALATVPDKYVISVTETTTRATTPTTTSSPASSTPIATGTTDDSTTRPSSTNTATAATKAIDGGGPAPMNHHRDSVSVVLAQEEEVGGETQAITLWDITQPGTVLHSLKLFDVITKEWTSNLRGSVYGIAVSGEAKQQRMMLFTTASSGCNTTGQLSVVDLPEHSTTTCANDDDDDGLQEVSIRGSYEISCGIASTGYGDWFALSGGESVAGNANDDTKLHDVASIYSINDISKSLEKDSAVAAAGDMRQLEQQVRIVLPRQPPGPDDEPSSTMSRLTTLSLGSHLIAGYTNGTIVCARPRIGLAKEDSSATNATTNELASCSTATRGLRGCTMCPHLSAQATNPQLRNECTIM